MTGQHECVGRRKHAPDFRVSEAAQEVHHILNLQVLSQLSQATIERAGSNYVENNPALTHFRDRM
jgi:hypothetical protein